MTNKRSFWARVVQANKPGAPDDNWEWRASAIGAVIVAIMASWGGGLLSIYPALLSSVLLALGGWFSWKHRYRPLFKMKAIIAVLTTIEALILTLIILHQATGQDVTGAETTLALLLIGVQMLNIPTVTSRRDVGFVWASSVPLLAIGASQSLNYGFIIFMILWAAVSAWGGYRMWCGDYNISGGRIPLWGFIAAILALSILVVYLVPPPQPVNWVVFPTKAAPSTSIGPAGRPAGPGSASVTANSAVTRVGGYAGFGKQLNTGIRGKLSNQLLYMVRASNPSYWVSTTYNEWNGQTWVSTLPSSPQILLRSGSPFNLQSGTVLAIRSDIQTFYAQANVSNELLHAQQASTAYFPSKELYAQPDTSTYLARLALDRGAVYTMVSQVSQPSVAELRQTSYAYIKRASSLPAEQLKAYLQLPRPYTRVSSLTRQIVSQAGATGPYSATMAIQRWMQTHVKYTLTIPPLQDGQDAVNSFLFGSRRGYCEQISTAMVIMLRSLGIPTREAVGFIPGTYNPVTGLYSIRAKDAHAWVQVDYPGFGWINFDPTSVVPLANPNSGQLLFKDLQRGASQHWPYLVLALMAILAGYGSVSIARRWRNRPRTWAQKVTRKLETKGKRWEMPRKRGEPLEQYVHRLREAEVIGATESDLAEAALAQEYGGVEPSQRELEFAKRL